MKIDQTQRIAESLDSGVPFEEQLAAAKASGRLFKTAQVNGQMAVVYPTDEEIEYHKNQPPPIEQPGRDLAAELDAEKARAAAMEARLDALERT